MKAYVINLERDAKRLSSCMSSLKNYRGITVERISAVYGPSLPKAAIALLGGHRMMLKWPGTLGGFLSHARAWEAVASQDGVSLILEDDAVFLGFERVHDLQIPEDADIIFLNDRMSPGSRYAKHDLPVTTRPIEDSLRTLNRTGFGVGADGYLLTQAGAQKLLEATAKDLYFGIVDWRLLRYSVTPSLFQDGGAFAGTRVAEIIIHHHNPLIPPAWGILKAYCLDNPLIAFATGGESSREKADSL